MLAFMVRRTLLGVVVLIGVLLLTFVVARIVPSDPARMYVGDRASPEQVEQARRDLGLDRPLYVQLAKYFADTLRGDLGNSLITKKSVASEITALLPATLQLVVLSLILALAIGLPMGLVSATKKDRWPDHISRLVAVGSSAMPVFWLALMLQFVFHRQLGVLPIGGVMSDQITFTHSIPSVTGFPLLDAILAADWTAVVDQVFHLILPVVVLGIGSLSSVMRLTRASMVGILHEDYITAARSYGLPERSVVGRFALKNAMGPTATVVALLAAYLIVNTFLIESLFSWPGVGRYIANAVVSLDFPAIMGVTIIAALSFVVLNLVADLVVALDPRVRIRE